MLEPSVNLNANHLREKILRMAFGANSVHIGCAFSIVEIVTVLVRDVLRLPYGQPDSQSRDRLVLSKGHGAMALYAAYNEIGWIQGKDLEDYFRDGSLLHGLCEAKVPGVEVCSGSLGHGLPIAVGMALGSMRQGLDARTVCVVGDGEMNEGTMWEALLFAAHHRLRNLTVIVDANGHQAMGRIHDVIGLEPLAAKFDSFGFDVAECDGHDEAALRSILGRAAGEKPRALIARTVKGKGVSFMEDNNEWHYRRLNEDLLAQALKEISVR